MSTNQNTTNRNTNTTSNITPTITHHRSFIDTYLRHTPTTRTVNTNSIESKKVDNKIAYKTLTYNLDSSISTDLSTLYTNKICSTLLKNDCTLFGDFVIEFFSTNLLNFSKAIQAYGDIALKNIIERDLYGHIYSKHSQDYPTFGYTKYRYRCICDNNIYDLTIYYLNYLQKLDGPVVKGNALFNIDNLVISRKEIKVLSFLCENGEYSDLDVPLPLGHVLNDINKKQFYINTKITNYDQLQRIIKYISMGWKNNSTTLLKEKSSQYIGKLCEICHEKINKGERVCTLKCKHFFHKECWYETIGQHINNTSGDIINCPTCRKTYYIHEII